MARRTRSSPGSSIETLGDTELSPLTRLSHGWYTEDTLITVLGEQEALNLLQNVRKGSQNGYIIISDQARSKRSNDRTTVYYIRYPELRTFESIRVSACEWMKACREIKPLVADIFVSRSTNHIPVAPNDYLLQFILRYAGVDVTDTVPRGTLKSALADLIDSCKLCGVPDPRNEPDTPLSFPSSAGGYAPKTVQVGPFVDLYKRERESNGKFKKTNPRLLLALGRVRCSIPQQGIRAVTSTMANVMEACEIELATSVAQQHDIYMNFDMSGMVPKSSDTYSKCTRTFASYVLLKFVKGVVENGGWISMSADGGKRMGKNLFPCSASFFNGTSSPSRVEFAVVTCGDGGSTGEDAARIMLDALNRMRLMRYCLLESKVLSNNSAELMLAHITADGGPDMQTTLTSFMHDKLGSEVPVIHCFMHTHSLVLQHAYRECFDEGHQPDLDEPGVMALLKCVSWMFSTQYPSEQRKKLIAAVFDKSDPTMHASVSAALEEIDVEDAKENLSKPQAYVVMLTRWGSFGRALTEISRNWCAIRELMFGIYGRDTGSTANIAHKIAKWMQDPGLKIECEFVNVFCELWYNLWYHSLLSDAPTETKYSDRDLVAGFRCGEMPVFCAAMEVELKDVINVLKTILQNPDVALKPSQGEDGEGGTLGSRPAMHKFKREWNEYLKNAPEEHVKHLVKCFNCFLDTAAERFAMYNNQWFTKFFYMAIDYPLAHVSNYFGTAVGIMSAHFEKILNLEGDTTSAQKIELVDECWNLLQGVLMTVGGNIKLWEWSPVHNLKALISIAVGHLVTWFKEICSDSNKGKARKRKLTNDTKLTRSPWPMVDHILNTKGDLLLISELQRAVRATQHHNQLSERNVGNAARAIRGKKSFSSRNQSDLIIGATALQHEKYKASRKLALERRQEGEALSSVSSTSSAVLVEISEQRENQQLTDSEMNALEEYIKKVEDLPDPLTHSRIGKESSSIARLQNNRKKARKVEPIMDVVSLTSKKHSNQVKLTAITHAMAVDLLNQLFPKEHEPWIVTPGESKKAKQTLIDLAKRDGRIVVGGGRKKIKYLDCNSKPGHDGNVASTGLSLPLVIKHGRKVLQHTTPNSQTTDIVNKLDIAVLDRTGSSSQKQFGPSQDTDMGDQLSETSNMFKIQQSQETQF